MTNKKPNIETLTERTHLAAGSDQTVDVLVRIVPPPVDTTDTKRPKLNIGISLDRSGSMGGDKMVQAREAAKYCVDQMMPRDRFSAVIFDNEVDVLFTSQPVENKDLIKRGIDRITHRGSTALHEGWVKAGIQVSECLDQDAINRVLLITDGQANVGETRPDEIVSQARKLAEKGVSTSTIGIGADFNEDLLMPMAEAGQGNGWHVREPADMVKIFETELQGLVKQIGHSVTFGITPAPGVRIEDVLNDFEKDGSGRYILPNLQAGSPLDIVVRLRVPALEAGAETEAAAFDISYIDQGSRLRETATANFTVVFDTAENVERLDRNPDVVGAVRLLMNARARKEMMEDMDRGAYENASHILKSVVGFTDADLDVAYSAALAAEREDLDMLSAMIAERENDPMTRKLMSYRRESTRKGK